MIKINSLLTIATSLFLGVQCSLGQTTMQKTWVTLEDINNLPIIENGVLKSSNNEIQTLIDDYNIVGFNQALYSSKLPELLKVYEIQCYCDVLDLEKQIIETSRTLSNPQPAPEYDLLLDPDDYSSIFPQDYALDLIEAKAAWDNSTGDSSIVVGISDGNYHLAHEELENEYVSVNVPGVSPASYYNHGTAVATTAAGKTDNGVGKSSIGFNCKLALTSMGYNQVMQLSDAGVPVINMSWASGCSYNSYLQTLIDQISDNGTILIAAAGNGGTCGGPTELVYPAAFNHVISVTSIGSSDNHEKIEGDSTSTHQHNSAVDLCAPGYLVGVTIAPEYYTYWNGSSFAAPYVAGTVGLMLSVAPCLSVADVEEILELSADNIDSVNLSYAGGLGAGRLNARAAVEMALAYCAPAIDTTTTIDAGVTINNNSIEVLEANSSTISNLPLINTQCDPIKPSDLSNDESMATSSITEISELFSAAVYPNPTQSQVSIEWNQNATTTITVVNILGELIMTKEMPMGTSSTSVELPTTGIYLVTIEQNRQLMWSQRVIKI